PHRRREVAGTAVAAMSSRRAPPCCPNRTRARARVVLRASPWLVLWLGRHPDAQAVLAAVDSPELVVVRGADAAAADTAGGVAALGCDEAHCLGFAQDRIE